MGIGEVKDAFKVFVLSNWKKSFTEKGKTAGGTEGRVRHVPFEMLIKPPNVDINIGSWLHRLELRGMVGAGDTY